MSELDKLQQIKADLEKLRENNEQMRALHQEYVFLIGGMIGIMLRHKIRLDVEDKEIWSKTLKLFFDENPEHGEKRVILD